ncbi:MAG: type II toxin-antitoxin system RelE/ParE family toxin [Planctomycetota bacterium]
MEVRHDDDELARIESDPDCRGKLDAERVRGFRKVMNLIRNVQNETELYQWKGGHFEKLEGSRSHQRSLRTSTQWRLIVEIEKREGPDNNVCVIKGIEDYH